MELADLLESLREEIDDEVEPYLWSDTQLTRYLNEAVHEAAVRARLLVESERADICEIALQPDVARYPVHAAVILIRRAALDSDPSTPLQRTTTAALDGAYGCSNWRTQKGPPEFVVVDQQGAGKVLIVSPTPTAADTLRLTVIRWPTEEEELEANDPSGEPPIEVQHHEPLIHWAAFRALNNNDVERGSKADAADQLALFQEHFGRKPTARELQHLAIDRLVGSQPVWF